MRSEMWAIFFVGLVFFLITVQRIFYGQKNKKEYFEPVQFNGLTPKKRAAKMERLRNQGRGSAIYLIFVLILSPVIFLNIDELMEAGWFTKQYETFFYLTIPFYLGSILFWIQEAEKNSFEQSYKELYVRTVLQKYFGELTYKPIVPPEISMAMPNVGVIPNGKYTETEDYIEGCYNGVFFKQRDVKVMSQEVHNDDSREQFNIYKGTIMEISLYMNRLICPVFVGIIGTCEGENLFEAQYGKFIAQDMEAVEFNKKFIVRVPEKRLIEGIPPSTMAFYVLKPQTMILLDEIAREYWDVSFAFTRNKLYAAYKESDKKFKPDTNRKFDEKLSYMDIEREVRRTTRLIELLQKLYNED